MSLGRTLGSSNPLGGFGDDHIGDIVRRTGHGDLVIFALRHIDALADGTHPLFAGRIGEGRRVAVRHILIDL